MQMEKNTQHDPVYQRSKYTGKF